MSERLVVAADHGGIDLKKELVEGLVERLSAAKAAT